MQYKGVNQAYLWDFCLFWSFDNGCSETRGVISDTESPSQGLGILHHLQTSFTAFKLVVGIGLTAWDENSF